MVPPAPLTSSQDISAPVIPRTLTPVPGLAVLYQGRLAATRSAANDDTSTAVRWMTTGTVPGTAGSGSGGPARPESAPKELS